MLYDPDQAFSLHKIICAHAPRGWAPHSTVRTAGPREAEAAPAGGWKLTILHHLLPPLASSLLFKTRADSK